MRGFGKIKVALHFGQMIRVDAPRFATRGLKHPARVCQVTMFLELNADDAHGGASGCTNF
ncbi:hypothetical protein EBZ80_15665 [bacterium]|nr:hypothetical protein [bacterium]